MTIKDIKEEARKKLALNMHQAIVIYTVEFTVFITLIALVVIACVCLGVNTIAAIVMICYGCLLGIIAFVACGMVNFAMVDFYLATYRCKPYNVRRLGDTLARSNITKIFLISLKRTLLALLLLLCLIVPGVIYLIRTSVASYLLIANPKMKASTALSASNKVMSGKTGAYFALCMSLIGWYLLGILTLGLGFIFISPYVNLIKTEYYKRNIQGDKNMYVTEVQPVSPPNAELIQNSVNNMQMQNQAVQSAPNAQQEPIKNIEVEPAPAPIDTLAEEDVIDLNAAMRDFGAQVENVSAVPEVPIAPPIKKVKDEPIAEPVVVNVPVQEVEQKVVSKSIDGSNIIETERVLSAEEISASEAAKEQVLANMYAHPDSHNSAVNYFADGGKQSPDDFVTREVETDAQKDSRAQVQTIKHDADNSASADSHANGGEDDFVMSDSDFEEFLRGFDSISDAAPEFPLKRSQNADTNKNSASARESRVADVREHKIPERGNAERPSAHAVPNVNSQPPTDRAERIRLERERKNLINKK